jgi:zinc protease
VSRSQFLSTVSFLVSIGIPARAAEFPYPIDHRTLDNGLEVYVIPMGAVSEGVVALATWMEVGSRDEVEPGSTGFAHFFEHLMFHGTPTWPADRREQRLLALGLQENAWTWLDETVYHAVLPASALEELLTIEADRFRNLSLQPEGVRREAGAAYGEFRKEQSDPGSALEARLRALAFGKHSYGHPTIGIETDIAAMPEGYERARAFFDRYYRPERALVLLVGDVQPEAAHALVAQHYGGWARGSQPEVPVPAEPAQAEPRRGAVEWSGPGGPRLVMAWKVPGYEPGEPRSAALQLAAELLDAPTGELVRRLVREEKLADAVHVYHELALDTGLLVLDVEAKDASELPRIEGLIREVVGTLARSVEPGELDALRTHLRYRRLLSQDDPLSVLEFAGEILRRDPAPGSVEQSMAALAAVSAEQVAQAIQTTMTDSNLTLVTLLPEET